MIGEIFSAESFVRTCAWQSTLFVTAGLFASFILRRRSSRAHQVLFLSMLAAVIVPAASTLVKHYESGIFSAEPVVALSQPANWISTNNFEATEISSTATIEYEPSPIELDSPPVKAVLQSSGIPWIRIALYGWIATSLILFTRLLVTFVLGMYLLGKTRLLGCEKIEQAVHCARQKLGIQRNVKVYCSRTVRSPVIWCWKRMPVLLVPGDVEERDNNKIDWTGIVCHELAHLKRRDHITGLLAELIVCILPWHLLLWLAKSRLLHLSEQACDDWVIASGQDSAGYAESLLGLIPGGQMAFVPAVVSNRKGLAGRIRRILKDACGNPRTGAAWVMAVSIVAICLVAGLAFAQTRPAKPQAATAAVEPNDAVEPNKVVLKLVAPNSRPVVGAWVGTYVDWSDIAENPPIWFLKDGSSYKASEIDRADKVISDKEGKITLTKEELFKADWPAEQNVPLTAIDEGHYLAGLRSLSQEDLGKEITLTMQPGCRVHGLVTAATARKHKWSTNLLSVLVYWGTPMPCCQYTTKQGRFEFVLPPGIYAVRVYAEHADKSVMLSILIKPGQRELDLTKYLDGTSKLPAVNSDTKYEKTVGDEYERVPLGNADAGDVAKRLNEAIEQMPGSELQRGVFIQPLTMEGQIVIFGRRDLRDMVKKLIAEMDVPPGTFVTKIFLLKYADPGEVKKNIKALYGHMTDAVRVISYIDLPQVTVIASPQNMLKIERQIAEWDVPLDKERIRPRIFTLDNSDPAQMAGLLTKLFAGEAVDMYEVLFGKDTEEKRNAVGPSHYQLTFEDVPGTRKIIVISNFPEAYDIVGKLILELDKQQMATKDIKEVREWIAKWIEQLDGSGTTKNEQETIALGMMIFTVSDAFLKDIGLDPNTLEPAWVNSLAGEPFALMLDKFDADSLLNDVQRREDCKLLAQQQFLSTKGEQARISVVSENQFIIATYEPNNSSDTSTMKLEKLQFGTFLKLKPELTVDAGNITLGLEIKVLRLADPKERKYDGKNLGVVTERFTTVVRIPNGQTLPMVGQKIAQPAILTSQEVSRQEALWSMRPFYRCIFRQSPIVAEKPGRLLILIKPTIDPGKKADV